MKNSAEVVANIAHELRSPIAIIQGFAETLQEPNLPSEKTQEIVEKIARASNRLEQIVTSLLRLADAENESNESFSLVDLETVVRHGTQQVLTKHPEANIVIRSERVKILGDADLLELAVINVLENGIKYSQVPAQITVQIWQKDHTVLMTFEDLGFGIPAESLPHIFERFYCVNKRHSRKLGGAGLGLSLVKAIVEKHKGSISVTSICSQGSVFTIALPID